MANINTVTSYKSSTGLTTATVTEYFSSSNDQNPDALKAVALVTMAAETGFQATSAARLLHVPLFSERSSAFIPTKFMVENVVNGTFPAGTDIATASLGWVLSVATTPATVAMAGSSNSGFTPTLSTTALNAVAAAALDNADQTTYGAMVGQNTLITAASTNGTPVPGAPGQIYQGLVIPVHGTTQQSAVVPGQTLYISPKTGGTVTTADLTVTGTWRFYIFGNYRIAP